MGRRGRPLVLVDVEPVLLGQLLVTILQAVGEDEVRSPSDLAPPSRRRRFSVALVSAAPTDGIAEVTVVLPPPGQTEGTVLTKTGPVPVDLRAPLAVLEVLDRFCPAATPRCERAAQWDGRSETRGAAGWGQRRVGHHAGRVK